MNNRFLRRFAVAFATLSSLSFVASAAQLKGYVTAVDIEYENGTVEHTTAVVNGNKLINVHAGELKSRQITNLEGTYVVLEGEWDGDMDFNLDEDAPVVLKGKFRRSEVGGPVDRIKKDDGNKISANFREGLDPLAFHRSLWIVGAFLGNTNTLIVRDWSTANGDNTPRSSTTVAHGVPETAAAGSAQGAGLKR